jgi:hypothetical protein
MSAVDGTAVALFVVVKGAPLVVENHEMVHLSGLVRRIDGNVREMADVLAVKAIVPLHLARTRGGSSALAAVHRSSSRCGKAAIASFSVLKMPIPRP